MQLASLVIDLRQSSSSLLDPACLKLNRFDLINLGINH